MSSGRLDGERFAPRRIWRSHRVEHRQASLANHDDSIIPVQRAAAVPQRASARCRVAPQQSVLAQHGGTRRALEFQVLVERGRYAEAASVPPLRSSVTPRQYHPKRSYSRSSLPPLVDTLGSSKWAANDWFSARLRRKRVERFSRLLGTRKKTIGVLAREPDDMLPPHLAAA